MRTNPQVEAALSTVTTTKQALNGDRKVTDAKNNAKPNIIYVR